MEFLQLIQQVPAFHFYSKQKKEGESTKDCILYSKTQVYWDATWSFLVKWQSLSVLKTPLE